MSDSTPPADTQATLLLCGTFTARAEVKPLTPAEYNAVAAWLHRQGRRPGDLLGALAYPASAEDLPPGPRVRALLGRGVQMAAALERWAGLGLWVVGRAEDAYPERLRRVLRSAAPPLLFGAGDRERLDLGGVAIVGSREADEAGLDFAARLGRHCALGGVQVVSGGARGVDRAAVAAALEADGGAVVVLAERLDRAATARDGKEALRDGRLALLSPYEPEAGFTVARATGRNKVIYALADAAVVVSFEAGTGGTWGGATEQLVRNKPGAASVPVFIRGEGNPADGLAELIRRGAHPFPEAGFWDEDAVAWLARVQEGES